MSSKSKPDPIPSGEKSREQSNIVLGTIVISIVFVLIVLNLTKKRNAIVF